MTDNDIIKALECCKTSNCDECPFYGVKEDCEVELPEEALDLINRLQAEIERLGKELIKQQLKNNMLYETAKEAKTEAVKEFAERLKRNHIAKDNKGKMHLLIEYDVFDNFVKEMTKQSVNYGSSKKE